jgi:circadian clock protein KaiC
VTDAVIQLDHRVHEQISTRRIRVVKYRGSHHGTNEYPFLIDADGINVLPVTSLTLEHDAPSERVSSGLARLDEMLGGQGYYRGSTILVTGTAGTGKTTLAAHFVAAACERGQRSLYFLFEESPRQVIRNMRAAGVDLETWVDKGLLQLRADRPSRHGLEAHLAHMHRAIEEMRPDVVVVDPMTNLLVTGTQVDVRAMLTRIIDFLKTRHVTALVTSLTPGGVAPESTETVISSLMDTWVMLTVEEVDRRRHRWLSVLKSRGMPHSDDVRAFRFTDHGIDILPTHRSGVPEPADEQR